MKPHMLFEELQPRTDGVPIEQEMPAEMASTALVHISEILGCRPGDDIVARVAQVVAERAVAIAQVTHQEFLVKYWKDHRKNAKPEAGA